MATVTHRIDSVPLQPETLTKEEDVAHYEDEKVVERVVFNSKNLDRFTPEEAEFLATFDAKRTAALYRKVDWRVLPMLALLYLFAYLDRANIGNAKIEGMPEDLGMSGVDYNIVVSIFFVPYILFEVPSNIILQRFFSHRPSLWLGTLCIIWGIVMTCHGAVQNYAGLLVARIALGIPEAGFFPGAVLICSNWYPRHMLQTRVAMFYMSSAFSGAFSGLLAYAIAKMNGIGGIRGWRWIFIIEGLATVALGALVPFVLANQAKSAKWLTEEEKRYLSLVQSAQDGGTESHAKSSGINWRALKQVLTDWQLYLGALVYWGQTAPNYGFKFNLPSILKAMGYTSENAQLMSIPPYIIGAIAAYTSARFSDKLRRRYPIIAGAQLVIIIAYSILTPLGPKITSYVAVGYFAVCFANVGFYPIIPGANAWMANNLAGQAKRAMGTAFFLMMGNIGGIFGSYLYIDAEAPAYPTGYGCSLGLACLGLIASTTLELNYIRINKRRDKMSEAEIRAKYTDQELIDMGDRSPLYRYTL